MSEGACCSPGAGMVATHQKVLPWRLGGIVLPEVFRQMRGRVGWILSSHLVHGGGIKEMKKEGRRSAC